MEAIKFEIEGVKYTLEEKGTYSNGRIALQVYQIGKYGPEPYMTLTCNFPESSEPEKGYFYAKYWSENKEFFMKMKRNGILDFHPKEHDSFYLSDKLLHRCDPLLVRISNEYLPEDEQFEVEYETEYEKLVRERGGKSKDLPF